MWGYMCALSRGLHMEERGQPAGSHLPPCGSQGWNSGRQAKQQAPLPTEQPREHTSWWLSVYCLHCSPNFDRIRSALFSGKNTWLRICDKHTLFCLLKLLWSGLEWIIWPCWEAVYKCCGEEKFPGKKRTWGKRLARKEDADNLLMSVWGVLCLFTACTWYPGLKEYGAGENRLRKSVNLEEDDGFVVFPIQWNKVPGTD